jgi:signal transduction histidine kinase
MATFSKRLRKISESFIPLSLIQDPESNRKARLIVAFGFLGGAFGFSYAAFYFLIGHYYGAWIITACSTSAVLVPFFLRWTAMLRLAGNIQALILTLGFFSLGNVEGGVHGHAIAWLAAVPLCALLLADKYSARIWCVISFFATSYFCVVELAGITLPPTYPPSLHSLITAVGFMGLTLFMSLLGLIFENGRARAFKRLEDAHTDLSRANAQLIQLNREKDEFLGIAAHDLKNRIHNVRGMAELISDSLSPLPDQVREDAEEIVHAAVRMQEAVGNLLAMDAIEEGKLQLTLQVCDLVEITHRVIRNYRSALDRKKVQVEFFEPPEPVLAVVDFEAALQVMDNLVSNAIKYSPYQKRVVIRLENHGSTCRFLVKDEGQGFSESDKKRLFNKFVRLSATPTGGESSTGLGLSIVKKIVEAMGGAVECESTAGAGSTFIVTLPSGA